MSARRKLKLVVSAVEPKLVARPIRRMIPAYRPGETQRCPDCDGTQWHLGRSSAECAFCHGVLPLAGDGRA